MRRFQQMLRAAPAPAVIGSFNDWLQYVTSFSFDGVGYEASPSGDMDAFVSAIGRQSGLVAGAIAARGYLMSQLLPVWRNDARTDPQYGQLFGNQSLDALNNPHGSITRQQFMMTVETHVAFAGKAVIAGRDDGFELLRPDRAHPVMASTVETSDPQVVIGSGDLVGWLYYKNGHDSPPETLMPEQVATFIPEPNPTNPFEGEAWVWAVVEDVMIGRYGNEHVKSYFKNGATPRTIIMPDKTLSPDQIGEFQGVFDEKHRGAGNAYKTAWIGGGSSIQVIGSNLADLDLTHVTGAVDSAVSVRSRVPASVLGTREGMQGSALNAGNYTATRRLWADGWFTPHADNFMASVAKLLPSPAGGPTVLTFDPDRVLFLQEDRKDAAEIDSIKAAAIRQLIDAGFEPSSAVDAIVNENFARLNHTGLTSVQLVAPDPGDNTNE